MTVSSQGPAILGSFEGNGKLWIHNWELTNQIYLQDPLDILDSDSNIYNFASFSDPEAGPRAKTKIRRRRSLFMPKPVMAGREMMAMEVVAPTAGAAMMKMMKMEGLLELGAWVVIPALPVVLSAAGTAIEIMAGTPRSVRFSSWHVLRLFI